MEFKAKNVDIAIAQGLTELGLTQETADITVKNNGGLFKQAVVEINPKGGTGHAEASRSDASSHVKTHAEAPKAEKAHAPKAEKPAPAPKAEKPASDAPSSSMEGIMSPAEEKLGLFFEELLHHLQMNVEYEIVKIADNELKIRVYGDAAASLIGHRGETLDALQYLSLLVVNANRGDEYIRVTVDAEDYRERREKTLIGLAYRMAKQASTTGRPVHMEPMNPAYRRIIHTALQDSKNVKTESAGDGNDRHVVIIPKGGRRPDDRGPRGDRRPRYDENRGDDYMKPDVDGGDFIPQGADGAGFMGRGADHVSLAHEHAEDLPPTMEEIASAQSEQSGGSFSKKGFGKLRSFGNKRR